MTRKDVITRFIHSFITQHMQTKLEKDVKATKSQLIIHLFVEFETFWVTSESHPPTPERVRK
jgi:hypothetical protein